MSSPFPRLALAMLVLLSLPACRSPTTAADLPIAGDWTEPIHDVRMMAKAIRPNGLHNSDVTLVIFIQNTGDEDVSLPDLWPELHVITRPEDVDSAWHDSANLRIEAVPLEGQDHPMFQLQAMQGMSLQHGGFSLRPGEISPFAICFVDIGLQFQLNRETPDAIPARYMGWYGYTMLDGRWELRVSYLPSGIPRPPRIQQAGLTHHHSRFQDTRFDLPPVTVELEPTGELLEEE